MRQMTYAGIEKELQLTVTAAFGLEAVVKREIAALGYEPSGAENGSISFEGDGRAIARANLHLRSADRVLVRLAEFDATSFEDLFEGCFSVPWERIIEKDGKIAVSAGSVKSRLKSLSDCQSIAKKAIIKKLQQTYEIEVFPESGTEYSIRIDILKDRARVYLDSSGAGLHKRGYRVRDVAAPIRETLAAALIQLSFYRPGRILLDPFCGSGTIPIEAALMARNIAPGLSRSFAAEKWPWLSSAYWKEERKAAFEAIRPVPSVKIKAFDRDASAIRAAMANSEEAGVDDCIEFARSSFSDTVKGDMGEGGIIITNPPYGERMGDRADITAIYRQISSFMKSNPSWSVFLITSDRNFEKRIMRTANRRRKLYNGRIETCYYQFHGIKPKDIRA